MDEALSVILARIDKLISEDEDRGRQVAHDFVDWLAGQMELLASERIELEQRMASSLDDPRDRTALVEEIAARLEETAGKSRFAKELIDSIIERLYRLDPEERSVLADAFKGND